MFLITGIQKLKQYSYLLSQLVRRDFKVKYKRSVLGILWSLLNPLLTMIVMSFVFSNVFDMVDNYPLYLLSGIVVFNYVSEATNMAMNSITGNMGFITKVYIPKFILPVSKVLSAGINLGMSLIVFYIIMIFSGVMPNIYHLLLPVALVCLIVFVIGISFILSASVVFFRDIQHLYGVFLTMWMYGTPILYTLDIIPKEYVEVFKFNPLFQIITFIRTITLDGQMPTVENFIGCFLWAIVSLVFGAFIFKKSQDKFIYYV